MGGGQLARMMAPAATALGIDLRVLVEAPEEGDGVWFADVERDRIRDVRRRLPALAHRRLGTVC